MGTKKKEIRVPSLVIEGPMCISEAAGLKEKMAKSIGGKKGLMLDLGEVSECDAAGIQLICAARLSAAGSGKRFAISKASQAVKDAFARSGLSEKEILRLGKENTDG